MTPPTRSPANEGPAVTDDDLGGDGACYAHLLCPNCGAVLGEYEEASSAHSCAVGREGHLDIA